MMSRRSTLRILDANANRALEGVRVCEDIVRFHFGSSAEFRRLRALRHGIAQAVRRLPVQATELVRARDAGRDPGHRARASRVSSLEQVLLINLQRTKESLRSLEECTRLFAPRHTGTFQRLRFRAYDVERQLLLAVDAVRDR